MVTTTHPRSHVSGTSILERPVIDDHQAWRIATALCILSVLAVGVLLFIAQVHLYRNATTRIMDLAYFVQPLEGIRSGFGWEVSIGNTIVDPTTQQRSLFAEHLYLLLIVMVPLYLLFPSVYTLFVVQAALPVVGAYIVFVLARHKTNHAWISLGMAATYLLYFPFQWSVLNNLYYGFHMENLFPVIFLLGVLVLEVKDKPVAAFAVFTLSLLVVESYALVVAGYALYQILMSNRHRFGAALLGVSTIYLAVSQFILIPRYRDGSTAYYTEALASLQSLDGITALISEMPAHGLRYGFYLLVPLLLLPLVDYRRAMIAIPVVAVNFMALGVGYVVPVSPRSWHTNPVIPILFLATIGAITFLRSQPDWRQRLVTPLIVGMVGVGLVMSMAKGPFPTALGVRGNEIEAYRRDVLADVKPLIPTDVELSVDLYLGSHFVQREHLHVFPDRWADAEYILADTRTAPEYSAIVDEIQQDKRFEILFQSESVYLFKQDTSDPVSPPD